MNTVIILLLVAIIVVLLVGVVTSNRTGVDVDQPDIGGEIGLPTLCGKILPWASTRGGSSPPCLLSGTINPGSVLPPLDDRFVVSSGTISGGYGSFISGIDFLDYGLQLDITMSKLSSDVTSLTLHSGGTGLNGPLLAFLSVKKEGTTWRNTCAVSEDDSNTLRNALSMNSLYVLCKTINFPEGELRGQLTSTVTDQCGA